MYKLLASLSVSFVAWIQSLGPFFSPEFMFPSNRLRTQFTKGAYLWTCWLIYGLLNCFMSVCACFTVNTIMMCKVYQVAFCFTINTVDEKNIVRYCYIVKLDDDRVSDWLMLIAKTPSWYIFSYYQISNDK